MRAARVLSAAFALLLYCPVALAQTPDVGGGYPMQRAGMFWHYNVNQHRVGFQSLPGVPGCCQEYEEAIGTGFTGGALFEVQFDPVWTMNFRISYGTHDATITDTENLNIPDNGTPLPAEIEHAIDATLSSVDFDAILGVRMFAGMHGHLGFRAGMYTTAEYYQNESLVKPIRYGTFENGRRVRNEFSGDIPRLKNVLGSIIFGLSYQLPLNERGTIFLTPELQYLFNVTAVVKELDWYADGIHIGLAVKFGLGGAAAEDKPGRDEYEEWRRNRDRTAPQPNTLRDTDQAAVPSREPREIPSTQTGTPPAIAHDRAYEDDDDEQGNPFAAPPEQRPPAPADAKELRRKDLEPVPTDSDISPAPQTQTVETIRKADAEPAMPLEDLTVTAFGMSASGEEKTFSKIEAEEFGMTDVVTLLNYVFFHENSSQIPNRYSLLDKKTADAFRIGNLDAGDKLRQHYNVLNIIGSRLREYPEAEITLVGCNTNTAAEEGRLDLSRSRAETVRDYLRSVWGVSDQRMTLVSRMLPENPSLGSKEANDENRRVEIYSDTWEILRPIVWTRTEWRPDPASIRFEVPAVDDEDITRWRFSITQDDDVMKEYSGSEMMPEAIDWNLTREQPFRSGVESPIEYVIRIHSSDGKAFMSKPGRIPVSLTSVQEKRIAGLPDKEFTRYHLIMFERGEEASAGYKEKVTEMVTSIFGSEAVITIVGFDEEDRGAGIWADSALRIGANDMQLNTRLPEGRFYSRAFRVLVEAPVQR